MSSLSENEIAQQNPSLYNSLHPLLRVIPTELNGYLEKVACKVSVPGTKTQAHCYFITLDGNRRPRVKDFARFIADKIADFAIPRSEIERALKEAQDKNSVAPIARLNKKANKLFTTLPNSGEGGEVLLSLLAEAFIEIPQIFTKMVLKTNSEMHVHGSDGIHAGVNNDGHLALYWGESKLYKNANSAIKSCFNSLAPFLLDTGGSDSNQERDLQLMRDGLSLPDPALLNALKHYLDPDDPMFKKMEYRGLCLVGFDSDSYPTSPNSKEIQEVKNAIEEVFMQSKEKIHEHVTDKKIESFTIEVFCLPFPSVEEFRMAFRKELGLAK
ncbi:HamA C-terminal domain-containing protein [Chlorobium ferrooxidans]|uniref:Anti-bacteriophage protein A/HamA C-terminal domain-containing protein n=1 Tax=Chlorobium ferrooxidans DSM 13031 TaxID=377431 RepID=Q0YUH4_9CHLB|nr:DUF1837 domain-containing protein [Chlorobium ferrooxidans]EAT60057.1 conserved hypothetical protein [Chlorobium ferrooxidans DSM 13031]